jgi:phenylalanyl-tRNA synthetase alpha chain
VPGPDTPAADPHSEAALDDVRSAALAAVAGAADLAALQALKPQLVGDRSPLAAARKALGALPGPDRAEAGKRVNAVSQALGKALDERRRALEDERDARVLVEEAVDVTLLPGRLPVGARHPLTTVQERICDVFVAMGWEVAEGPEVEHEWFNFDALNFGGDHPAREMQDTLFVAPEGSGRVLRTHTSPVQVRSLLTASCRSTSCARAGCTGPTRSTPRTRRCSPSSRACASTRASRWRTCAAPSTRSPPPCSATACARGCARRTSRSPSPSAELDLQCFECRGASTEPGGEPCRVCSSEGWIEVGGCGMVNPAVLRACGVDPERYSGFAFGMGLDRTLMFRHGITDIRDFYEGDQRFTLPFGLEA